MKRFLNDEGRGISMALFAELAGIGLTTLKAVFIEEKEPLTEYVQTRVNKALASWKAGDVAIMERRNQSRYVEYRKQPKPRLSRSMGLQVVNGEICMKVGVVNRADYSTPTLEEQLWRS